VPENLDLVRAIFADWERGDFSRADWADPDIEFIQVDGPAPSHATGLAEMATAWRARRNVLEHFRVEAEEIIEVDETRVMVLVRDHGRAKTSGIDIERLGARTTLVLHLQARKVTRLAIYWDRDRAFADLGLEE
jgi:ketosteroid isomerase-like protein